MIVYGDSIMTESQVFIAVGLAKPGWRVVVRQFPGTAMCDWDPVDAGQDATLDAHVVVTAFSGDVLTPCA